jgi:predicted Zn-dependent protease
MSLNPTQLENELRRQPTNFQLALNLAGEYFELGQKDAAFRTLDQLLQNSNAPAGVLKALLQIYGTVGNQPKVQQTVDRLAALYQQDPSDLQAGMTLAEGYRQLQKPQLAAQTLDQVLNHAQTEREVLQVAQQFIALNEYQRLEAALQKLTKIAPGSPEGWYDLAALESILGKQAESLQNLRQALQLGAAQRLRDPKARDLMSELKRDPRFNGLRALPEFKELVEGK